MSIAGGAVDGTGGRTRSRSLGAKLLLRTFPVVALVVLLTQAGVAWVIWTDQRRDLVLHATMVADLTAEAIARPLWYFDRSVFEPQVRAIARDPDFRYSRVFDDRGIVLFEAGDRAALDADDVVVIKRDVVEPGEQRLVGRLEVVLGTSSLTHTFRLLAIASSIAFAVLLLGFSAAAQIAVRRLILRPLDALLAAMGRVERKDWATVDWRSDDELGRAAATFNRMVGGLQSGDEAKRLLAELREAQAKLLERNAAVERANAMILSGIRYARRIQEGMLPAPQALEGLIAESAVWWEPLQSVGGDFYWMQRRGDLAVLIVADCTGHGVPGAFMTLVAAAEVDQLLARSPAGRLDPAALLQELDRRVRQRLRQEAGDGERPLGEASDDGLEAAVCVYDSRRRELDYAGAGIGLLVQADGRVERIRPSRGALGYRTLPAPAVLEVHRLAVRPGDAFILHTDGVTDQVGGSPRRVFGRRRLAEALAARAGLSLQAQIVEIRACLEAYRDGEQPRDDVTLLAFRPVPATGDRKDLSNAGA